VRRWAVRLLGGQLRDRKTRDEARELLIGRGLADADESVRQATVAALFRGERRPDPELVLRVVTALGGGDLDAAAAAARSLPGVEPNVIADALRRLEGERPVRCPVCQQQVRAAGLNDHLIQAHGYVDLDGSLLSYADALKELWRRLVAEQQEASAAWLVNLLVDRHAEKAESMFRNAFEAQLTLHAAALGPYPNPAWQRLAACLGGHELTQRVCVAMLERPEEHLRGLARLALIPIVAKRLGGKAGTAAFLTAVENLCPLDGLDVRVAVCEQLADAGASKKAAGEAAAELEQQRETPCPYCGQAVRRRDEAEHLRREHGVYEIDGVRCAWDEALARLLADALAARPDRKAARRYVEVASDRLSAGAVAVRLAADVAQQIDAHGEVPPLGAVAALEQAADVFFRLVEVGQQRAALALCVAMGKAAPAAVLQATVPLIGSASLPADECRRAVELVLTSRQAGADLREQALIALLGDASDPLAVLARLDDLEGAVRSEAIGAYRQRLRESASLACPACGAVLNLKQLEDHAWQSHRLVLQRGRWRAAWDVIEGWLDEFAAGGDEAVVYRALELAALDDDRNGRRRVAELAMKKGLSHPMLGAPGLPWAAVGCAVAVVLATLALAALLMR
jgi:uncharacterized C2H2 Zn-finger protein